MGHRPVVGWHGSKSGGVDDPPGEGSLFGPTRALDPEQDSTRADVSDQRPDRVAAAPGLAVFNAD